MIYEFFRNKERTPKTMEMENPKSMNGKEFVIEYIKSENVLFFY